MSVWQRLAWACLLLSVVWLSYLASEVEDAGLGAAGRPAVTGNRAAIEPRP